VIAGAGIEPRTFILGADALATELLDPTSLYAFQLVYYIKFKTILSRD
jgi:hypothetical protein